MSRQSLQEYADGSKPLTASVVKQMLDYADGKVGSAHMVTVAGTEIDISKIGTEKIPFQGFSRTTKSDRAWKGQGQPVKDALGTLACKDGGKVDPKALLKALSTAHEYTRLELSVTEESTPAAIGDRKNRVFAAAVRALDNKTLSSVYQGIASRETDALKDELARLMAHPDVSGETQMLAEQEFADICRLESLVLQQVSERILAGDKGPRRDGDVTATNLGLLVGAAGKGAIGAKDAEKAVETTLKTHGMDAVEARQIGNTIRNNELTINMHLKYLVGWEGLDKGKEKPSFLQPGGQVLNAFQVQEAIGEPPTGGYLQLRNEVETQLFPEYADKEAPDGKDRPVYAALNIGKITSGAADTAFATYGRAVVVLKEHVKKQCTYTFGDTFFVERFAIKAEDFDGFLRNAVEDFADARAEFTVDDVPYVFTAEEDGTSVFVYAVVGALPEDEDAKARVFAGLLHAQYCFSESCGFSFGVDADDTFVLLQALVDTDRFDEDAFVALMDKFVKTANVWSRRLDAMEADPGTGRDYPELEDAAASTADNAFLQV